MSCINNFGDINETFIIEPLVLDDTFVTGFTLSSNNIVLTQNRIDQYSAFTITLSGLTGSSLNVYVTGGTYNNTTGTATFVNSTGGTFQVTGFTTGSTSTASGNYLPLSGGTVTGNTIFQSGLTANTISATTISGGTFYGDGSQLTGIIASAQFTGGTVNGPTNFISGLTANTISATTYQNLPKDVFVTGGTYSAAASTLIFKNNTGGTFNVSGITSNATFTGGTVSGATNFTGGLSANTISATTYYNVSSSFQYEIHVSQVDGSNTTGNGTLLNPVASITKALTLVDSQRKTIVVHPGTYTENPSITTQYTVLTTFEIIGGNTVILGTVSATTGCTISGLKMTNLTITAPTGPGNVNILNCDITGTLTKSSTADYTLIRFCDIGTTNITGGGGGTVAIFGGNPNFITVNNAGARVLVKNAVTVAPVLSAGSLTFADCVILSTSATTNAFTTAAGTFTTLANSQIVIPTFQNVARISLGGFYSILNCVYDRTNSSLTGISTNSIVYSQFMNADKFITQGGTLSQYVMGDGSLSNGFTGGTVSGSTNFISGLTANTISATTYQNLPKDIFVTGGTYSAAASTLIFTNNTGGTFNVSGITSSTTFTGGTVSGATSFISGLTANTISATTYFNLPVTADTFVTGFTLSSNTITLTQNRTDGYSAFTISLSAYTGSSTSVSGAFLPLSGGTVSGNTIFTSGLTANTISATTYQNLPNTLYTGNGVLSGDRIVDLSGRTLNFSSSTSANNLVLSGGSVGIGTATPSASALFELSSTTKGFLGPRMTEAQRLAITATAGLIVYQTDADEGYFLYKSFGWVQIM